MNKKIVAFFIGVTLSLLGVVLSSGDASAIKAADLNRIIDRAKIADLQKCHGYFAETVDIMKLSNPAGIISGNPGNILALPNGTTKNDGTFSCETLLTDYMGYSFKSGSLQEKVDFLSKMGYKPDTSSTSKIVCYRITFTRGDDGAQIKTDVCFGVQDSKITSFNTAEVHEDYNGSDVSYSNILAVFESGGYVVFSDGSFAENSIPYEGRNISEFENELREKLSKYSLCDVNYRCFAFGDMNTEEKEGLSETSGNPSVNMYRKGPLITNTTTVFTEDERVGLLLNYFRTYGESSCYWVEGSTEITVNGTKYYVSRKVDAPTTFYIISGNSWYTTGDWDAVVGGLNGQEIDGMPSCDNVTPPPATSNDVESDEDMCFNGANSLGWIICPIITALRNTLETIYDEIITPFLQINVSAFNMDNNGVYKGWQTFQGFANIAFVILLLVVIFSQVTGIGIDNLGIKRILPKLIVAAVLINLSYIICQLLVDVSNIAGYGLRSLFESIQVSGQAAGAGQGILTTAISGAIAAGVVAGGAATAAMWLPAVILPLLLGLITILISVLFMFILLGVRQAGVIILVVVSPLAFVMYMLPNTKNIFQRWWKAFTGLLLLFPICGVMIGGSALAGKILASTSTSFWTNLIAALLTVVPFFFVPTLLKGSFSALGNLGAKISGFGQRMAGGIGKVAGEGVKRTGAFKNIQANAKDREELRSRVAERRRLEGITNRIGNIQAGMRTPEQQLQYARAQAALEKMNDEDLFSNPELIQSEAASKRFNRQVEAMKSKNVASGMVNRIGEVDGKTFDGTGNGFAENTLAYSLYNAADDVERYALTSQLMASGHHGAEALHQVMTALGNDGNSAALATIAAAAKGDNKLGELKSGARSTYDYINDVAEGNIQGGAVGSGTNVADYAAKVKWGGMSEQQLVGTDKEELRRYRDIIADKRARMARGENVTFTEQEQKLISQANAAWSNDRIRGSAKKDVQDLISQIAYGEVRQPGQGVSSGNASEGESFDVRGGEDEGPSPVPPSSPSGGGGSPAPSDGSPSVPEDNAFEEFMNAQQIANEDRIARNRESRRNFQEQSGMDDATYEMMEAQQRVNADRRSRANESAGRRASSGVTMGEAVNRQNNTGRNNNPNNN